LLARLEEEGYIASAMEPQDGRPPRKMLSLTAEGEAAFQRWMVEPVRRPRQFRQELLAKLFFANNNGPETLGALLAAQRDASRALLADLQRQIDAVPHDRLYEQLVYRLRVVQTEAHLRWLEECEEAMLVISAAAAST
ncbi:MAG: PadR family transcriptional regulator, partial [Anaerolineae bacterium]|nr:PadR family transcriptional regulator [Anaerolineae bacterium]